MNGATNMTKATPLFKDVCSRSKSLDQRIKQPDTFDVYQTAFTREIENETTAYTRNLQCSTPIADTYDQYEPVSLAFQENLYSAMAAQLGTFSTIPVLDTRLSCDHSDEHYMYRKHSNSRNKSKFSSRGSLDLLTSESASLSSYYSSMPPVPQDKSVTMSLPVLQVGTPRNVYNSLNQPKRRPASPRCESRSKFIDNRYSDNSPQSNFASEGPIFFPSIKLPSACNDKSPVEWGVAYQASKNGQVTADNMEFMQLRSDSVPPQIATSEALRFPIYPRNNPQQSYAYHSHEIGPKSKSLAPVIKSTYPRKPTIQTIPNKQYLVTCTNSVDTTNVSTVPQPFQPLPVITMQPQLANLPIQRSLRLKSAATSIPRTITMPPTIPPRMPFPVFRNRESNFTLLGSRPDYHTPCDSQNFEILWPTLDADETINPHQTFGQYSPNRDFLKYPLSNKCYRSSYEETTDEAVCSGFDCDQDSYNKQTDQKSSSSFAYNLHSTSRNNTGNSPEKTNLSLTSSILNDTSSPKLESHSFNAHENLDNMLWLDSDTMHEARLEQAGTDNLLVNWLARNEIVSQSGHEKSTEHDDALFQLEKEKLYTDENAPFFTRSQFNNEFASTNTKKKNRDGGLTYSQRGDVRLFVGRLPKWYTNKDLKALFDPFGPVIECYVIRDRREAQSQGCGFVRLSNIKIACKAIAILNQTFLLDQDLGPLQVKFATGELQRLGLPLSLQPGGECVKVFFGNLTFKTNESELRQLFGSFGKFEELCILRDKFKRSKCSGFVTFHSCTSASNAISALNGQYFVAGASKPLEVRLATSRTNRVQNLTYDQRLSTKKHLQHY